MPLFDQNVNNIEYNVFCSNTEVYNRVIDGYISKMITVIKTKKKSQK